MIRLLQWLFLGHVHRWDEIEREPYYSRGYDGTNAKTSIAVHCRCAGCGLPRKFKCTPQ